jgi:hypothetical protein
MAQSNYLKSNRLADILALIQVLALDRLGHRSESGLEVELQGVPKSALTWKVIAKDHPEFFRVGNDEKADISLIARHVIELNENNIRELPWELIKQLLDTALSLYNIEKENANWWRIWIPVLAAITAAIINILVTVLSK